MYNYKKVQFIAWEVYTGPEYIVSSIDPNGNLYYEPISYAGIKNIKNHRTDIYIQCIDIEARIAFTKDAIEKALSKADESSDVLKIFMAPEFIYRGSGGVYLHDLINGWKSDCPPSFNLPSYYNRWSGLFGKLKELVENHIYKDWLFIFGTAVSGFFSNKEFPFIDTDDLGIVFNTTLIQRGGPENKTNYYILSKKHNYGLSFIKYSMDGDVHLSDSSIPTNQTSFIPDNILGKSNKSSAFSLLNTNNEHGKEIKFGIEICLDHYCNGNLKNTNERNLEYFPIGKLKSSNKYVDIQLVPSCGMTLKENSLSLCQQEEKSPMYYSYGFNCDGSRTLQLNEFKEKNNNLGSHVQIWDGSSIRDKNEFSNDFKNINTNLIKVTSEVDIKVYYKDKPDEMRKINEDELWSSSLYPPRGSGYIRVINTMPLSKSHKIVVIG